MNKSLDMVYDFSLSDYIQNKETYTQKELAILELELKQIIHRNMFTYSMNVLDYFHEKESTTIITQPLFDWIIYSAGLIDDLNLCSDYLFINTKYYGDDYNQLELSYSKISKWLSPEKMSLLNSSLLFYMEGEESIPLYIEKAKKQSKHLNIFNSSHNLYKSDLEAKTNKLREIDKGLKGFNKHAVNILLTLKFDITPDCLIYLKSLFNLETIQLTIQQHITEPTGTYYLKINTMDDIVIS